jgi:ABC-type spermidine/putrescine transport system permease subunit II
MRSSDAVTTLTSTVARTSELGIRCWLLAWFGALPYPFLIQFFGASIEVGAAATLLMLLAATVLVLAGLALVSADRRGLKNEKAVQRLLLLVFAAPPYILAFELAAFASLSRHFPAIWWLIGFVLGAPFYVRRGENGKCRKNGQAAMGAARSSGSASDLGSAGKKGAPARKFSCSR